MDWTAFDKVIPPGWANASTLAATFTPSPYRFLPCMVSGLSFYLAQKHNPGRVKEMKLYYEDELQRALTEDGQRTSVHLVPQNFFRGS